MLIVGVDFETTGLDTKEARIIEIGAVLWNTTHQAPLGMLSMFVNPWLVEPSLPPLSDEITRITGITPTEIQRFGKAPPLALETLNSIMAMADDCIVAHNGTGFDRPLYEAECQRHAVAPSPFKWVDTSVDVPYPPAIQTRKLTHLAAEHGFLNPFAHRAVTDVLTMLRVLSHYPIDEVVKTACEPNVTLVADTKKPWRDPAPEGKKESDLAKARGFRWDGAARQWKKVVKASRVDAECAACEFPVKRVETAW